MEISQTVQCPFCGESMDLSIDTGSGSQRFTIDCEVCCRPMEVYAECRPGEILHMEITGG